MEVGGSQSERNSLGNKREDWRRTREKKKRGLLNQFKFGSGSGFFGRPKPNRKFCNFFSLDPVGPEYH